MPRPEIEIISFSSQQPFNSEIYLTAVINKLEATDILNTEYLLYVYGSDGDERGLYSFDSFPEAVRKAYEEFGNLMVYAWDDCDCYLS
ncbi:hypothetical protein N8603_03050 [Verrucomicrobiales bacterium]|nr:hypothetical protein [Verrucomicrobiales bacterium]